MTDEPKRELLPGEAEADAWVDTLERRADAMSKLYIIAHKVRGEPAFDIAQKMECSLCNEQGCDECDDCGYWWIIPTSGHRAYPYDYTPADIPIEFGEMPDGWTDHYVYNTPRKISLAESLGITKSKPPALPPIVRRI